MNAHTISTKQESTDSFDKEEKKQISSPLRSPFRSPTGRKLTNSVESRRKLFENCKQVLLKAKSRKNDMMLLEDDEEDRRRAKSQRHLDSRRAEHKTHKKSHSARSLEKPRRSEEERRERKSSSRRDDDGYHRSKSRRDLDGSKRSKSVHRSSQERKQRSKSRHRRDDEDRHLRSKSRHRSSHREEESSSRRSKSRHRSREEEDERRRSKSRHRSREDEERLRHHRESKSSRHLDDRKVSSKSNRPSKSSRHLDDRKTRQHKDLPGAEFTLSPSRSGRHLRTESQASTILSPSTNTSISSPPRQKEITFSPTTSRRPVPANTRHQRSSQTTQSSEDQTCSSISSKSSSTTSKHKIKVTQQEYLELKESIQKSRRGTQKDILARLQSKRRVSDKQRYQYDSAPRKQPSESGDIVVEAEDDGCTSPGGANEKPMGHTPKEINLGDEDIVILSPRSQKSRRSIKSRTKGINDTICAETKKSPSSKSFSPSAIGRLEPGFEIVVHSNTDDALPKGESITNEIPAFWESEEEKPPVSPKRSKSIKRLALSPNKNDTSPEFQPWSKAKSSKSLVESSSSNRADDLNPARFEATKFASARALQSSPMTPRSRAKKKRNKRSIGLGLLPEDSETSKHDESLNTSLHSLKNPFPKMDSSPRRPARPGLQRMTSWRPPTDLNDLATELEAKRSKSVKHLPTTAAAASDRRGMLNRTSSWRPPAVRQGPSRRPSEGLLDQRRASVAEKPRAVYTEEDIFTSYTWSLTRQDFYNVQKERLLLKDSIRDTALFRAYQKIAAA